MRFRRSSVPIPYILYHNIYRYEEAVSHRRRNFAEMPPPCRHRRAGSTRRRNEAVFFGISKNRHFFLRFAVFFVIFSFHLPLWKIDKPLIDVEKGEDAYAVETKMNDGRRMPTAVRRTAGMRESGKVLMVPGVGMGRSREKHEKTIIQQ